MPSNDGVRLQEDNRRPPPPPRSRQHDPKYAVTGAEVTPLPATLQRAQLVPQRKILEDQVLVPAAGQRDRADEPYEQFEHGSILM